MIRHDGSREMASRASSLLRSLATTVVALTCLTFAFSATVALAAPAAPVISGPTAIQFANHPAGFRSLVTWEPVPTAVEYRVYNADTLFYVGNVTDPICAIYGMQGVLYHHYVVAVDSTGATSTPSNIVDILTMAPAPPAPPEGLDVVQTSVFSLQTSTAPLGDIPVKVPYNPAFVVGDPTCLKLMRYSGTSWVDVTTSVDTTRGFVLGTAPPVSVFAVMQSDGSVAETVTPPVVTIVSTISPTAGPHGSISPGSPQTVEYGADSATFTISPDAGHHVSDVLIDGVSVGPVTSYRFADVTTGHLISASFAANPVRIATSTRMTGPASVRVGRRLTVTGRVTPARAPGTVTIVRSRLVRGHWVGARSSKVVVTKGRYRFGFTPSKRGTWRLVARFSGGKVGVITYTRSAASVKRVTVR